MAENSTAVSRPAGKHIGQKRQSGGPIPPTSPLALSSGRAVEEKEKESQVYFFCFVSTAHSRAVLRQGFAKSAYFLMCTTCSSF